MFNCNTTRFVSGLRTTAPWPLALLLLVGCTTENRTPPTAQSQSAEPAKVEQPVTEAPLVRPQSEKLMSDKPADAPALLEPAKEVQQSVAAAAPAQPAANDQGDAKPSTPEKPSIADAPTQSPEPAKPVAVAAVDQVAQAKAPTRSTSSTKSTSKTPAKAPVAVTPPPPPPSIPPVLLSDGESKTCLVKVGDSMPAIELPSIDGQPQSLAGLLGSKLTVVVFWTANHPYAVEELGDLAAEVAGPLAAKGVKVVAINEGDTPEVARKTAQDVNAGDLVQLQDTGGQALAKVATRRLPRTYLLDSSGKILWFDLEYSRSTRRDLHSAIKFVLGEK